MFQYYLDLLNKPKIRYTYSEALFVDIFPYLIISAIIAIIIIISLIVDFIKRK